jgi:hypothetical protein
MPHHRYLDSSSVRYRKSAGIVAGVNPGNLSLWQTTDRVNLSTESDTVVCASGYDSLVRKAL